MGPESPRSRCCQGWFLVRALFLACWWLNSCIFMWYFVCAMRPWWCSLSSYGSASPTSQGIPLFWPHCGDKFLGPRWIHSCPGCQVNTETWSLARPWKHFPWPEMQYIQSANPQMPSKLWALYLFLCSLYIFYFLFLVPYSYSSFYKSFLLSTPFCSSLNSEQ